MLIGRTFVIGTDTVGALGGSFGKEVAYLLRHGYRIVGNPNVGPGVLLVPIP